MLIKATLHLALLASLAATVSAQDHSMTSSQGRTAAGLPFVDILLENVTTPYDPGQDITEFSWTFAWWDYTSVSGSPEIEDFIVVDWPAAWPGPSWNGGLTTRILSPGAPVSPFRSESFRVVYSPALQAGDPGDPPPADVHFRDKRTTNNNLTISTTDGPRRTYDFDETTLTAARLVQNDRAISVSGTFNSIADLAADAGRVAALYQEAGVLRCATSDDTGLTWQHHVVAAQPSLGNVLAGDRLLAHKGHLYTSWTDERSGSVEFFFARSVDGGQTWDETVLPVVSGNRAYMVLVPDPGGDPSNDRIYISYITVLTGPVYELHLALSHDGGATFMDKTVTTSAVGLTNQDLAATPNGIHLLYSSSATHVATSTDGGMNFTAQTVLLGPAWEAKRIAAEGQTVVVAETDRTSDTVLARVSTDGGASYSMQRTVGDWVDASGSDPLVVEVVQGVPLILWTNSMPTPNFSSSRSVDGGLTWSAPNEVQPLGGQVTSARTVEVHDGVVTVVRRSEMFHSTDAGLSWSDPVYLNGAWPGSGSAFHSPVGHGASVTYDATWDRAYAGLSSPTHTGTPPFVVSYPLAEAAVTSRTFGSNPQSLTTSQLIAGDTWIADVDLTTTGHAFALVVISPSQGQFLHASGDYILLGSAPFFSPPLVGPNAAYRLNIPIDVQGAFSAQAIHLDVGLSPRLSNAVDLVAGLF